MELSEADRLCLDEAARRGELSARIVREGRPDPDGEAVKAHLDDMAARGLLVPTTQTGTRAHRQGAELRIFYRPTEIGLALRQVDHALELALDLLDDVRAAPDHDQTRRLLQGPRWRELRKATRAARS